MNIQVNTMKASEKQINKCIPDRKGFVSQGVNGACIHILWKFRCCIVLHRTTHVESVVHVCMMNKLCALAASHRLAT